MTSYGVIDERTPLTKTQPPDYVYMTNPNRLYRKQVHQFQCCICFAVLTIFTVALVITVLYSVDKDIEDQPPVMPVDNASLQLLLGKSWPLPDKGVPAWQLDAPSPEEIEQFILAGKSSLSAKDQLEASNPSLPVNSPSYRHQVSIKTSKRATNLARSAYVMEVATKTFVLSKSKPKNVTKTVGRGPMLSLSSLPMEDCGEGRLPTCPPSKYRTIDGSCNNPYKPNKWGVGMRPYRRQLASDYADGVSAPRMAFDGSPLPSARDVSVTVHRPVYRDDPKFTVMFAVWGQFMDHDITASALSLGEGGKPISCCQNSSSPMHPECFPVTLSKEDPYYSQYGISCMEFVRSAPAATCALGPREQLNQVSSYLDGSVVYGNTPELSRALRSYQGGQLKMLTTADGRSLLPISTNLEDGCNREAESAKGRYCFMAGDARANENTHITSLHLLMARQHNLVASQLADANPDWNDEKLYQEARKIVGAQMQHITYNEFLPVLLGPDMMENLDLMPKEAGYYTDYDESVDATVSNNFATSSFRFAHTLLPALMKTVSKDWASEESVEMHKMLFDPFKLYSPGALDQLVQGAISTQLERADSYFNTQVTQHLFQATGDDEKPSAPRYGLDLVSLNVQRGRDHGLPAYPAWREYCGLTKPKTFEDMEGMVDKESLTRMKALYKSVDDIDMYTGALSEFPIEGGMVGPTITCLVSDQFKRLKQGDSFFYETDKKPQAFTLDQLDEIRKTSLAGIICSTSDEVTSLQPQVMKSKSPTNNKVPCSQVSQPDFTKWTETTKTSSASKAVRIGLTVTGGSITTSSGDVLWDGSIPVTVPAPLFALKQLTPGSTGFGHGVQWKGSLLLTSSGLDISGTFSAPIFAHGPIPVGTNYTVNWINGEFKFNAIVTWNNTDLSTLSLVNSYESPIYFTAATTEVMDPKKQFVLKYVADTAPLVVGVERLPVVLTGTYSPDKTSFYWSGNATLSISSSPATPSLTATDPAKKTSGLFNVAGGSLKMDSSDGSSKTLWSGQLPAAIPLPVPYNVLQTTETGEKLPIFGNGLLWSASISGSLLEGSFNFPQYNRTFGAVSVNWLNGQFSFEVVPLMNTTLEELLVPGVQYTSRIIFRQESEALNLQLGSVFNDYSDAPNSLEQLVVESQEVIDGTIPAPLILHGTFSPDKTVFYFSGRVILAVKPSTPKIDKQLKSLSSPELMFPTWNSMKFGGSVNSGHITAGLNGKAPSTVWSGTVPVAIPMPTFFSPLYDSFGGKSFLFGNGVVWSGSLIGTTIKGTYSLPQTVWSMLGTKEQSWEGEFEFEISSLWNSSLETLFVPGAKYFSKINFQGAKYEVGLSTLKGVPGQDAAAATLTAPIILQGSYSLDRSKFYWSGSFIVAFKNKPGLMFTIPKKPLTKDDPSKPKSSIAIDITEGSIMAGFTGEKSELVWSGSLPATIPFSSLISSADSWRTVPSTSVIWSGEVKDQHFQGIFTVPTYFNNGTSEIIRWWAGNFSLKYTTQYGKLLEDYVKSGKKYNFDLVLAPFKTSSNSFDGSSGTKKDLLQLVKEADEVVDNTKVGKLILQGKYYSEPFYCYVLPFCTDKKEFYFSGSAILAFPDPPKNKSGNELLTSVMAGDSSGSSSSQFIGQVVSGSIQGGLKGESLNDWWTGSLPVQIPAEIFWSNKTGAAPGLVKGHSVEWTGSLVGNTLKGTFSFPRLVLDFPTPTVQWWTGQFVFDVQPLWNSSLDGMILSEATYSSGIYFQGIKNVEGQNDEKFVLGADESVKKLAPIILQGTLSPDGLSFLWSGNFIMSVKNYPAMKSLSLEKSKVQADDDAPVTPSKPKKPVIPNKPVKPSKPLKPTVSFTVITGKLSATNGSDPVDIWGGKIPVDINTSMFNPLNTPGGGASITWTADTVSPQLSGTFEVTVFVRNESILLPVTWSGNFSMHYLIKWSGSFDTLVKSGQQFTCSLIFKDMVKSVKDPGYIAETDPKEFVLGAGSGTPCTLILTGKSFTAGGSPFYCKLVPFMCSNKEPTNWFSFNGDALLVIKPPTNSIQQSTFTIPTSSPQQLGLRRINTTVISGSIVAGLQSEYPKTLWSGSFPMEIPLPVFWNSEDPSNNLIPPEDIVHAHGVIWSGSQMGPKVEGSFSLPQYTKTGVNWWTGKFHFLFQTSWGMLGDLDEIIQPGIYYNSKIVFRDIHSPTPLLTPSQIDVDTSMSMPIILLGTYGPGKKIFYWSGNVILGIRNNPWSKPSALQLGGVPPSSYMPVKPKERVGLLISSGVISNSSEQNMPIWSGSIPVTIPLAKFNLTEGVNVLWTANTLTPKFTGNFSIPQYEKDADGFKIKWIEGTFSFDLTTLWNTTIDVIEVGKQYATIISASTPKTPTKLEENAPKPNSLSSLIMEFAGLEESQVGRINLNGILSPDKMFFTWQGEAWFYASVNKTKKSNQPKSQLSLGKPKPFGGAVYDGYVTAKKSGFFSLSHTIWSGTLPAAISFSSFWSGFIDGATFTKGLTWTATSVSDEFLAGSYTVPQYTWDGLTTSVTWYKGDFKFYVRPLWNASLSSLIIPGTQYYSRIDFQGGKPAASGTKGPADFPGIPVPIILQGTYSPDGASFFWSGNFVLDVKDKPTMFMKPLVNSIQQSTIKTPSPPPKELGLRRINTTVISGSIVAGIQSENPGTLWSGSFPMEIPLPVFWNSEDPSNNLIPPGDIVHAHGVIWSGSQMGPKVEGSFSLPQYTKTGVNWWTGKFNFLFQTSWGMLGDLDEIIQPGIYYNSKIVFRDIHSPTPLLVPSQIDVDTSMSMPIILLGTYGPGKKIFYWPGNVILGIRNNPWSRPSALQLGGVPPSSYMPVKPKERVGLLISSGVISNSSEQNMPIWSGSIPVTIPLAKFNLTEGVNVLWTANTLTPKFSGNFSIPQYEKDADGFKIKWIEGTFSFDLTTLWNTTIDVIEVGKQYATIVSASTPKTPTKLEENAPKPNSLSSLIMEFAGLEDSQVGRINLNGILSPDKMFFTWQGEAWFYASVNKTKKSNQPKSQLSLGKPKPFGGAVYSGYVTAKKSGFFSLSHTIWSGTLPATISLSSFWSGSINGATFTKGLTWTATSVGDEFLTGSYTVPQYTWDGLTTSVTWYKGDFSFYVRPLWNASLSSLIVPGTQYYSRISFQGGSQTTEPGVKGPVDFPGIPVPIILQGTHSPDGTSFFWSGNFILDVKDKLTIL